MPNVVLINPFEVSPEDEEACLEMWEQAADHLRRQPGFISTRLHRAITPSARFKFVNVAEWESAEAFQKAVSTREFHRITEGTLEKYPHYPALFELIRT